MKTLEITPLAGIGPVKLGMTRAEVGEVLAPLGGGPVDPRSPDCDTYFDAAFQIHFDGTGRAEFIETAKHRAFRVTFNGHALHDLPAERVAALVSETSPGEWQEARCSYVVRGLQLAFWRQVTPEPDQDPDDDDGRYFDSVGAGCPGYFN